MNGRIWAKITILGMTLFLLLVFSSACAQSAAKVDALSLSGYIMDEHCFIKKPDPGSDSKTCLQMPGCAATGYGIAVKRANDTYKFYYFNGNFAPEATDAQLMAVNLINNTVKKDHIYITITGTITGELKRASDSASFQVINVTSMSESDE